MTVRYHKTTLLDLPVRILSLTNKPCDSSCMYKWTISAGRDRRRNRPAWVAISHGEIIGWCTIVGGLIGVFVRPDFRRQGIGTKLAERMIRGQGKIFASGDRPFRRKFYERFEDIILIQA